MLKEIVRPTPEDTRPVGEGCPHCGTPTRFQRIPCPDGVNFNPVTGTGLACLVIHYGWRCDKCGRDFREESVLVKKEDVAYPAVTLKGIGSES